MELANKSSWQFVGKMPEATLNPRLTLKLMNDHKIIEIEQNIRNNMDYYFELELNTQVCVRKQYKSQIRAKTKHYVTIPDDRNDASIGFDHKGNLYLLKNDNAWYVTEIPLKSSYVDEISHIINNTLLFGINAPYVITPNKRYIIIFGEYNICICDRQDTKWYESNINLPKEQRCISAMIVPTLRFDTFDYESVICFILSYWSRHLFVDNNFGAMQICSRDISVVITHYYPNFVVYIFGGKNRDKRYVNGINGLSDIYKIDLMLLLNNKKELKSFNKTVDIRDCRFYATNIILDECIICNEPPANCIFIPCGHVCVCVECMEWGFIDYDKCPMCGDDAKCIFQLMC